MEKHKINFTKLVESLRWYEKEYKGSIMDEEDKKTFSLAADVLEDLLQSVAEWTAKYEEARDRCNLAEKQLFIMENLVRCGECKHWHEVDSVEGTTYGECKRPHPIIRKHIFLNSGWYCADAERKEQTDASD